MIGTIFIASLLAAMTDSASPPGERAADRIVAAATADWGRLRRREIGDGEVWFEGVRRARAASYVLDKDGRLAMLTVYSANCAPFRDREGLIDLVVRALDPESPAPIQAPTSPRQNRYSPDGSARIRVGSYTVVGFSTGDLNCHHDLLGIQNDVLPRSIILPPR